MMLRRLDPRVSSALSRELNEIVADVCALTRTILSSIYFNLRNISLILVLVLIGYCYGIQRATRSWAETSKIGLKQQGFCVTGGRTYDVKNEILSMMDGVMLYRGPIVLDLSGASGPSTCFSQQGRQLCGNSFGYAGDPFNGLTVESLTRQFNQVASKPVLNNAPWILATSVVNLCVNLMLKSQNLFDDRGGGQQRVVFERFANFTTFLLVALLVSSSEQFKLIQDIDCRSNYPQSGHPDFCGLLGDCGAVLARVIIPGEAIIKRYREISLFAGVFVASAAFLARTSVPRTLAQQRRDLHRHRAIIPTTSATIIAVENDIESRIPFHESLKKIAARNKIVSKWRIVPATTFDKDSDRVCSICLEQLKDDTQVVVSLPCEHMFHNNCILGWITTGQMNTCPECRSSLDQV